MKNIFFALISCVALHSTITAQSKITYATFKECENASPDSNCYSEKLISDLNNLISDEIRDHIKKINPFDYFSVSVAFLSGADGKVIGETIEIACDDILLHNAIQKYIDNLDPFLPKDASMEERRSVHMGIYTYLYNEQTKNFEITTNDILREKGIKPKYTLLGIQPTCKGCENENAEIAYKCSVKKINEVVLKKYRLFEVKPVSAQQRMVASFIIEKSGEVIISDVISTPYNPSAAKELKRVLNKFPDFVPGSYRGIPVKTSFNLPVTLNF